VEQQTTIYKKVENEGAAQTPSGGITAAEKAVLKRRGYTDETIAKKGAQLKAVIEARRKGVEFLHANPKEAAQIVAKTYNLPLDVVTNAIANVTKMNPTWWGTGQLEMPLMQSMADALGAVGALQLPVDWKAAINPQFAPATAKTQ
jgi:NitT/TauT family transport system substrate-binding protein